MGLYRYRRARNRRCHRRTKSAAFFEILIEVSQAQARGHETLLAYVATVCIKLRPPALDDREPNGAWHAIVDNGKGGFSASCGKQKDLVRIWRAGASTFPEYAGEHPTMKVRFGGSPNIVKALTSVYLFTGAASGTERRWINFRSDFWFWSDGENVLIVMLNNKGAPMERRDQV